MSGVKYRDMEQRLVANSIRDPESGCWYWIGQIDRGGYGKLVVRVKGRPHPVPLYAHRVSFEVLKGQAIPDGFHVDHLCKNRRCINPDHLRAVPSAENLAGRVWGKGR